MIATEQWREVITQWLNESVELREIYEERDWSQSRVLRIMVKTQDAERMVYAKQARVEHAKEAAVYRLVAQVEGFPAPKGMSVSIDGEDWLLLEQAAGVQLARSQDIGQYREAVKRLAAFHQQSLDTDWLKWLPELENIIQRTHELAGSVIANVQACAADGIFTELDHTLAIRVQEELMQQWPTISGELADYPLSLTHGDSHSGNIFISPKGIQLIDWGSAAVAPGLLDLVGLLDVAERMNDAIGSHDELLEIYWIQISEDARRRYGSLKRAYRALQICRSLLELDWFTRSGDDYGIRSNRELKIIAEAIASLK